MTQAGGGHCPAGLFISDVLRNQSDVLWRSDRAQELIDFCRAGDKNAIG
jgi:hypothetical protein